jgi:LysM repeat protein
MAEKQLYGRRTWAALLGIGVFCAVAVFIAIALLIKRTTSPVNASPVSAAVDVGGQTVIIEPDPAMAFRIIGEQSSGASPGAVPDQIGADGNGPDSPAIEAPPPIPPPSVILINYLVVPGDTLYRLTQEYNTSIDLMASHNIAAASLIAGNTVLLPVANPEFCPGSRPHVVRDQQTVSEIARSYGTTAEAIGAANSLDANYSIKTSQVICVPN